MITPTPFAKSFAELYRMLARLFPDMVTIERLCHDADLKISTMVFSGPVINVWYQILLKTVREGTVEKLRVITQEELDQNLKLNKAWDHFIQALAQSNIDQEVLNPPPIDRGKPGNNQPKGYPAWILVSGMLASALIAVIGFSLLRPTSHGITAATSSTTVPENTASTVISTDTSTSSTTVPENTASTVISTDTSLPASSSTLAVEAASPTPPLAVTPAATTFKPVAALMNHHSCVESPNIDVGTGWTSPPMFVPATDGAIRTFSHCPPSATIQYDEIAVDDKLDKVEKVCSDTTEDISSLFDWFYIEGEKLIHYKSVAINLGADCRVDFTVQDTEGGNVGLMIKGSSVPKTAP